LSFLFGIGNLIFGYYGSGLLGIVLGLFAAGVIYWDLSRRGWAEVIQ